MADKYQTREERRRQLEAAKQSSKKGKKKRKGFFKRLFLILLALGLIGMISGVVTFAMMVKDAPKLNDKALKDPISSEIYDKDGKFVTRIGSVKREYVEYKDIPDLVKNAVIATEDSRFYKHHGVDPIRLGGAVIANFKDGYGAEGGSTITQQVVKNYFLPFDKTLSRKAQEAWLAVQLERKYSKNEIFEMYVNKIFMGGQISGIATASDVYFGKPLKDLTLPEAAMLAGMPQSPNNYNPFTNPDRAEKRRNIVLSLMHQHGYITQQEMEEAKKVPVTASLRKEEDREKDDLPYDNFIGEVTKELKEKYPDINPFTDGLKIYTTIDTTAQDYVDQIMYGNEIIQFPDEQFQAGITLLDTKTGEIRAIGGDRNPNGKFEFNYATEHTRQPGSTIKPILDYGPAIEYLKWGTYHTLDDKPYTYKNGTPINNWDNKHLGPMTMREALAQSRNIPALQALQAVEDSSGLDQAKDFAVQLGIPLNDIVEAYAIGGLKNGVTTLQMAGAYSAFGNEGIYTTPHAVKSLELRDGTKINLEPESKVVMKDYTAFLITDMLKSVVNSSTGTGRTANVPGLPLAGKTGTTNYTNEEKSKYKIPRDAVPDAWFAGYTTNYTAAVWTGYKDRKNYVSKGSNQRIAQQIFKNVMQQVSKGTHTADFTVPKSVEKVAIEKGTMPAQLAGKFTPDNQVVYEYAVKGNLPSQVSQKYDKLEAPSNVSAVYDEMANGINLSWSYNQNQKDVQFNVTFSKDGGNEETITTTSETNLKIAGATSGSTYTFKVTAVKGDQKSDASTGSVKIPDQNNDNEFNTDDKSDENQSDDNNNQNNGNQNENGNNPSSNDQGNNSNTNSNTPAPNTNNNGNTDENQNNGNTPTIPAVPAPPNTDGTGQTNGT